MIHTLITSTNWNSWIMKHPFGIFFYGIEIASLLITKELAYELLFIGFRFERLWELDKIAMQWFEFWLLLIVVVNLPCNPSYIVNCKLTLCQLLITSHFSRLFPWSHVHKSYCCLLITWLVTPTCRVNL